MLAWVYVGDAAVRDDVTRSLGVVTPCVACGGSQTFGIELLKKVFVASPEAKERAFLWLAAAVTAKSKYVR